MKINYKDLKCLINSCINDLDKILDLEPDEQGIKYEIKIHIIKRLLDKYYLP